MDFTCDGPDFEGRTYQELAAMFTAVFQPIPDDDDTQEGAS